VAQLSRLLTCDVLTIFPELIEGAVRFGVLAKAQSVGRLRIRAVDIRQYASDRRGTVDDYLYGGGPGMLMKPEPIFRAWHAVRETCEQAPRTIFLTPQGAPLTQNVCERLSLEPHLVLMCGRYKGVDERIRDAIVDEEISLGDYVLSGGEFAALVLLDALGRVLPGVLSDAEAALEDSFSDGLLDAPHYTRPAVWEGRSVPDVLVSGNPRHIADWERRESLKRTLARRPEMLDAAALSEEDVSYIESLRNAQEKRTP